MRKGVLIFLVINIIIIGFLVHSVWTLLTLLFIDGSEDQISRAELPAPNSGKISERPRLIPKIIHQTYINESIPEHWQAPQQSCLDLHPDYEYKVGGAADPDLIKKRQRLTAYHSYGRTRNHESLLLQSSSRSRYCIWIV
jgi:mannosyltransferase OCH1-like enzyme